MTLDEGQHFRGGDVRQAGLELVIFDVALQHVAIDGDLLNLVKTLGARIIEGGAEALVTGSGGLQGQAQSQQQA